MDSVIGLIVAGWPRIIAVILGLIALGWLLTRIFAPTEHQRYMRDYEKSGRNTTPPADDHE